jgi:hypothetical protein
MDEDINMLDGGGQRIPDNTSTVVVDTNAEAGPSTLKETPVVFLPPLRALLALLLSELFSHQILDAFLIEPKQHLSPLSSSQDLLSRFSLLDAYQKHVLPNVTPMSPSLKGKEKEIVMDADVVMEDEKEKKRKKREGSYKHLIRGIIGILYLCFVGSVS